MDLVEELRAIRALTLDLELAVLSMAGVDLMQAIAALGVSQHSEVAE